MVMHSKVQTTNTNRRGLELGSGTFNVNSDPAIAPPEYVRALNFLLADGVVFAHKLRAADWSVSHERAFDLRELFLGLGQVLERMNTELVACAAGTGSYRPRPELAAAFGRTRLTVTAPRGPVVERAEDTLADVRYLNAGLRVAAVLAERTGDAEAARVLLDCADELEGFGWLIAAWLN